MQVAMSGQNPSPHIPHSLPVKKKFVAFGLVQLADCESHVRKDCEREMDGWSGRALVR